MKSFWRQCAALLLPITVVIIVPLLIADEFGVHAGWALGTGLMLIAIGLVIMSQTVATFIRAGEGTLAPWSPPRTLITGGLYAYVRNPMIWGVILVLIGEALAIYSWRILAWAAAVFTINTIYFAFSEEPALGRRFGPEYRLYKKNVPRWLPRLRPYRQDPHGT